MDSTTVALPDFTTNNLSCCPPFAPHIERLPCEILTLIFKFGARSSDSFSLTVSHVNRRWRDFAIHCPDLWTEINLNFFDVSPKTAMLLDRSKPCLIDVTLEWSGLTASLASLSRSWAYALICQSNRWRRLTINSSDGSVLNEFTKALRNVSAVNLQQLSIHLRDDDIEQNQAMLLGGTPSLQSVVFHNIAIRLAPPLGNLTSFTMLGYSPTHAEFRVTLSMSQSLTNLLLCNLTDFCFTSADDQNDLRIELPSLRSFAIGYHSSLVTRSLLEYIFTPDLVYLEIKKCEIAITDQSWASHWASKYPKLQTLRLDDITFSEGENLLFLATSSISHVQLIDTPCNRMILADDSDESAVNSVVSTLWPTLEVVTIDCPHPDLPWLHNLINPRVNSGHAIATVRLSERCLSAVDRSAQVSREWLEERVSIETLGADEIGLITYEHDDWRYEEESNPGSWDEIYTDFEDEYSEEYEDDENDFYEYEDMF